MYVCVYFVAHIHTHTHTHTHAVCVFAGVLLSNEHQNTIFKEEIQNKFNLISEERVNIFEQNSENLMKSVERKLWHFEVSQIFKKH